MRKINLHLSYAGYCLAKSNHAARGQKPALIKFNALYGLLKHSDLGYILFDTGYSRRFYPATDAYPNKIYALATKVYVEEKDEAVNQITSLGIKSNEIRHIILSHFHADHIAGLKDFPDATIYCSKRAWEEVKRTSRFWAFRKGILHSLLPENIESRLKFIEDISEKLDDEVFGFKYDLFRDGSVLAFDLPGHAAGQIGILVETARRKYFLVADACWTHKAYKYNTLPHPIVRIFFNSWKEYKRTIACIRKFYLANPDIAIVPTHCSETCDPLVSSENQIDVL